MHGCRCVSRFLFTWGGSVGMALLGICGTAHVGNIMAWLLDAHLVKTLSSLSVNPISPSLAQSVTSAATHFRPQATVTKWDSQGQNESKRVTLSECVHNKKKHQHVGKAVSGKEIYMSAVPACSWRRACPQFVPLLNPQFSAL